MSRAFVGKSARELEGITTDLAWRQWRAIGGSAASKVPWHSIVDPEALILASLFLVEREPRISDILFSWVESNAELLSVTRLKNLQKAYPSEIRSRVADFARRTRSIARHPRWKTLSEDAGDETFPALPEVRRAARVPAGHAANLLLRLRMAIGVGVKADVLAVTLGNREPITVRELGDSLSYSLVGIRNAVYDLSRAGFILPIGGTPAAFAAPQGEWRALLSLKARPRWVTWHHWFAFVIDYITWCDKVRKKDLGEYAIDVKVRELVARHDLFFRYSGHQLGVSAFQSEVGSYPEVVNSLIAWAHRQERPNEV